ncbi:MAG TPA: tetratricopeptide repeat protein, partial [Gemmataceae bacterium]|nr:tetratricopeptide repeat protein [Gemmataceae bacterium]
HRLVLVAVVAALGSGPAPAGPPALWGHLSPGPHAVGFKSLWQLDYSRRYDMTFGDRTTYASGKAPRPILVNVWYPAKSADGGKAMRHRDYLDIRSADAALAKFSSGLADYNRAVIARELLGRPAGELADKERRLLDEFLDTPTACARGAAAEGKFPVVIYHAGHGSSFEDNSVLCEFLASHGYVVLGSAFQEPGGSSFGVDGKHTSAADMQFLAAYARQLPGADWSRVGVVGHSGGAHAALILRAQGGCPADAVVSLDTTQDYYGLSDPRWDEMTAAVTKNRKNMMGPLLMVANPHAFFEMADSLPSARRYYLTLRDLGHNDFISQGRIGRGLRHRLGDPGGAEGRDGPAAVSAAYEALCDYILHFFDAELKGDAAGKKLLATQYRDTPLGGAEPHVEYVPPGTTGPEPYREGGRRPPSPRQLRYFLHEHGRDKTLAVLRRFRKEAPGQPTEHPVFGLALVGELLDQGKTDDAVAFRDYYRESGFDCGKMLLEWGKAYLRQGRTALARDYFKKALVLDPSNGEAADRLKEAEKAPDGR